MDQPVIHFRRITSANVYAVCKLSDTLSEQHRRMVANNAYSIAEGSVASNTWYRAIYADDALVGFLMTHTGSDFEDGIDCPGVFLWRLMIAAPFHGKGYGRRALERLIGELRAQGVRALYTSCGQGEGSPEGFYRKLGFVPTGGMYDDEVELLLKFEE